MEKLQKMKRKQFLVIALAALLLITLAGCSLTNSQSGSIRNMGFPTMSAVPNGFSLVDEKSVDTGDWCELTYENKVGDFVTLDCYEAGTFDIAFLENYAKSKDKASVKGKDATIYRGVSTNADNVNLIVWEDAENNALCLLGGSISADEMLKSAESIKYDMKKAVTQPESNEIAATDKERCTIEEDYLKTYKAVLENATKPLFDYCMEKDKAIVKFELESFYKSFDFSTTDNLFVEVFDYDYFMKADEDITIAGGMYRDENGNVRDFNTCFGQLAAVSRNGRLIKAVPITGMDVELEPAGADEETTAWIKEKVMNCVKTPTYIARDKLNG